MKIEEYRMIASPVPGFSDSRHVKVSYLDDEQYRVEITMWDDESGSPTTTSNVIDKISFETVILPSLEGAFEKETYFTWPLDELEKILKGYHFD